MGGDATSGGRISGTTGDSSSSDSVSNSLEAASSAEWKLLSLFFFLLASSESLVLERGLASESSSGLLASPSDENSISSSGCTTIQRVSRLALRLDREAKRLAVC